MTPRQAASLMKEKSDAIATARARMATQMGYVAALAGVDGLRAMVKAELERIASGPDDGAWIG